jgi:hypothetical protein
MYKVAYYSQASVGYVLFENFKTFVEVIEFTKQLKEGSVLEIKQYD